jgi:cell division protein FtsL
MLAFLDMDFSSRPDLAATGASRPGPYGSTSDSPARSDAAGTRRAEKGAGNLKAIIWTMILVAFIYAAVMVLPVLVNEYQFQDSLQTIARYASINRKSNEQVKQEVLQEAQKEDLPVQVEDIKVDGAGGNVHINVDYSVTVDLKLYQWTLNFHPAANNAALL